MPGLKGEQPKGLGKIKAMMVDTEEQNLTLSKDAGNATQLESCGAEQIAGAENEEKLYTDVFAKVGSVTRAKYEKGSLPRLHRMLYMAILQAMNGKKREHVVLTPILDELEIGRSVSLIILACLEHYGYLAIRRVPNVRGKQLEFEVLRYI